MAEAVADGGSADEEWSDEAVLEFLKARQERIALRRGRIGLRLAQRNQVERVGSDASSVDFAAPNDAPPAPGGAAGVGGVAGGKPPQSPGGPSGAGGAGAVGSAAHAGPPSATGVAAGGAPTGETELLDIKRNTMDPLDLQIDESKKQLEEIILDGEALITNVRVAAECRETIRHQNQDENRKERLERLQKEADDCQEMYEDLKPNWDLGGERSLPLELFEKIKKQMQASEELLSRKQDLIMSLQQEIEDNDYEYEQSLEMYQKDVSLLGDRIDDNTDNMRTSFLHELNLVEKYTCNNRETFLEENQQQWLGLLGEFQTMEKEHLDSRKSDALNRFTQLNELVIQVKQECRANRHQFEEDQRILVQELEKVKYATQLNMEKLQYNLSIMRKRYKENVEMKNMMKRLLLKFNDRFTAKSKGLKAKMEAGKKESDKILSDIAKLEEYLSQAGRKTLHLAQSDWAKYMDLWMVSEEVIREKVDKLRDSEKFIFETQLGFTEAIVPDLGFLDDRPDTVNKYISKKNAAYAQLLQSSLETSTKKKGKSDVDTSTSEDITLSKQDCGKSASLMILPSDSVEFIPGPDPNPEIQRRLMKHVAKIICDESGFLVEEELRSLLEPLIETERNLVNLDALLKALGINTVQEMQYLAHFMLKRCRITKGIISKIGSEDSAHLSSMNVSLEGIVGKNAMGELDSDGSSIMSESLPTVTPDPDDEELEPASNTSSVEFQECECEYSEGKALVALAAKKKKECGGGALGETAVSDESRTCSPPEDLSAKCAKLAELQGVDDPLSLSDFNQPLVNCTPKCCSLGGSNDAIEEGIVELVDDGEEDDEAEEEEGNEEDGEASKCSTCAGPPHNHENCSFYSSEATVLSWAAEEGPLNENLKQKPGSGEAEEDETEDVLPEELLLHEEEEEDEEQGEITTEEIPKKKSIPPHRISIVQLDDPEEEETNDVPPLTMEDYGQPNRQYSEVLALTITEEDANQITETPTVSPQPFGKTDSDSESRASTSLDDSLESSSNGSTEFMYIETDEVIEALTEFCKDYNAKITVVLPTIDEIIDKKLTAFKYPSPANVHEYWEMPVQALSGHSDDVWDVMQYCFEQLGDSLIKRNSMVEKFTALYKQNQELSMLTKNHLASARNYASSRPNPNPGFIQYGRFCGQ